MTSNPANEDFSLDQLSELERVLAHADWCEEDLHIAKQHLSIFAQAARDTSQTSLAQGSEILGRLLELASIGSVHFPESPQLVDELIQFAQTNIPVLVGAVNCGRVESSEVQAFVDLAEEKWSQYLEALMGATPDCDRESPWENDTPQSLDSDRFETADRRQQLSESAHEDYLAPNAQIDLLLSAVSANLQVVEPSVKQEKKKDKKKAVTQLATHVTTGDTSQSMATKSQFSAEFESGHSPHQESDDEVVMSHELLEAFLDDAVRGLGSMEQAALAIEKSPHDNAPMMQFSRELHTLKGASASVALSGLASYLHNLETSLAENSVADSATVVESMFHAVDRVRGEIARLSKPTPRPEPEKTNSEIQPTNGRSTELRSSECTNFSSASADESLIRIRVSKFDRLMDMLAELVVLRNRRESNISEFNEMNEELNRCASRLSACDETARFNENNRLQGLGEAGSLSGSLSGSRSLSEIAKDLMVLTRGLHGLQKPLSQDNLAISQFIRDFRQELMQLRRTPMSGLFNRLQRAARDAAKSENKKVQLKVVGEDSGLEQELQERLYEPMLHIIRNAVSHGIENERDRVKAGKAPMGTIALEAKSNPQLFVMEVRDDGHGLNYAAIRRRAIEKGLLAGNQAVSNDELSRFILHPGFSTRDCASEVSGRGVGMDVVAMTLEQMRGRIDIHSDPGEGTTMRLSIPLRSGIEHVMVFRIAGQLFALPMQSVSSARSIHGWDSECPKFSLESIFGSSYETAAGTKEVLMLRKPSGVLRQNPRTRIAPNLASMQWGLEVDEIVGPEEVVVRGLPSILKKHPLFCGITLSGAGETVLLLDGQRLTEFYQSHHTEDRPDRVAKLAANSLENRKATKRALVVDDSLCVRKLLVKKLKELGITAVEAGDGIEGLEKLRHETFDLVFTDLDMPRLGGLEMLFDIQRGNYGDAPVVVISSRSEDEFRRKAIEHGAVDFLTKPVNDNSLRKLLTDHQLLCTKENDE